VKRSFSAKLSVVSNLVAWGALALLWAGIPAAAPLDYNVHKALHIVGVMLMMGNLIVGPVWLSLAWYSGDQGRIAWAAKVLSDCDIWLTTPGVQLAIWNGICMAGVLGGVHKQPWLFESMALMLLTSLVSVTVVLYWQERLVADAQRGDRPATARALVQWAIWGSVVGLPLTLVFWLMVAKQALFVG